MDLILPVYLNQKMVFDLVAMSQGGITTVTKVSDSNSSRNQQEEGVQASFGLSDAFSSLLKIGLSGKKEKSNSSETSQSISQERVHTPASLFFTLRNWLLDENKLRDYRTDELSPGDFVEFSASLVANPIIAGVDSITKLIELAEVFQDPPQRKKGQKSKPNETVALAKQLCSLSESLKEGGSRDLIARNLDENYQAVLTVEEQFLNDVTMSDLVDGTFTVLGKVVRVIADGEQSINLLRKTPLAHTPEIMSQLMAAFNTIDENTFSMPTMQTDISGPAIQVLPVAIFS